MDTKLLIQTLKKILKNKKIRYSELSRELGLSESGLKKMMSANDISMERLSKICKAVEISVMDLIQLSQTQEIQSVDFTNRQNELLLKSPQALIIFWQLTVENKTPEEIRKNEKMTFNDFQKIIFKLEKVDLIKTNLKGQITSAHRGLYRWNESTPLVQKINSDWSKLTLDKALANNKKNKKSTFHHLSYVQVSEKNRATILQKLADLMNEIAHLHQISKFESHSTDLVPLSLVIAADGSGFFDRE
jgi:DNA-binding Xre family transcriptional regulator